MALHNELGQLGERVAKEYLVSIGYRILAANWTHGRAEIDLIASIGKSIVFVEVKTRSSTAFGEPEDFVTWSKQRLLQRAAEGYLYRMKYAGEVRFDIIGILFDKTGNYQLKHTKDAFW